MLRQVPREAIFPEHPLMPVHVPKANQLATEGTKKSQCRSPIVVNSLESEPRWAPVNLQSTAPPSHLFLTEHTLISRFHWAGKKESFLNLNALDARVSVTFWENHSISSPPRARSARFAEVAAK